MSTVTHTSLRVILDVTDLDETVEHPDMGWTPIQPRELEIVYTKTPGPMRPRWTIQVYLRGPWKTGTDRVSKINATVGWTSHTQTLIPRAILDKVYGMKPVWFEVALAGMFTTEEQAMLEVEA